MNANVTRSSDPVSPPVRNIPSLDGMRASSIVLVILAHSGWFFPQWISNSLVFRSVVGNGRNGVAVFFVISGYLITTLLRREFERTGTISLKRFYFRRSMRIFPPFYAMLAVMAVLWGLGWIPENSRSFIAAATYTYALVPGANGYFIAHSWSLSIEELFYLFWPFAFLAWHQRQRAIQVAFVLVLLMPVLRIMLYFLAPALRGHENYMVHGWLDTMMIGCILAMLNGQQLWEKLRRRYLTAWSAAAMAVLGFLVVPALLLVLPKALSSALDLAARPTMMAICIGGVMVYLIESPECFVGRVLNHPVVRHVGVLSYSLYLWQQLFMSNEFPMLPYGFFFAFGAAELSYWIVERPSLRLRSRLERRIDHRKVIA
jgi:peptidoglycan/LPS O-acetylase OafA/YrhL